MKEEGIKGIRYIIEEYLMKTGFFDNRNGNRNKWNKIFMRERPAPTQVDSQQHATQFVERLAPFLLSWVLQLALFPI